MNKSKRFLVKYIFINYKTTALHSTVVLSLLQRFQNTESNLHTVTSLFRKPVELINDVIPEERATIHDI